MNVLRPFDVYQRAAATYTGVPKTRLCNTRDLGYQLGWPWPSALYSATRLPTIFQAGTPLDLRAYEAFPSQVTAHGSSPCTVLHAVVLETPR